MGARSNGCSVITDDLGLPSYCSILWSDERDARHYERLRPNGLSKPSALAIPKALCHTDSHYWGDSPHEYGLDSCARGP